MRAETQTELTASERIRTTFERNAKALTLKPAIGQGTAVTKVRVRDGLACDAEEGNWKLTSDMSEKSGGTSQGPNPGILGRAALGSCLAVGYVMWAAKLGITFDSLEVEVRADYDSRSLYGVGDVVPGYTEVRYIVRVQSEASDEEVMNVLDTADAHSDYLHVFTRPQVVRREVRLNKE